MVARNRYDHCQGQTEQEVTAAVISGIVKSDLKNAYGMMLAMVWLGGPSVGSWCSPPLPPGLPHIPYHDSA